ncbi:MAG: DUF5013 domain-containing protein [Bacteroidales bacterium]|nr:DUF5013 domain-containing protein [Bacteroidales bacterium]
MKKFSYFIWAAALAIGATFAAKAFEAGNPASGGEDVTEQYLIEASNFTRTTDTQNGLRFGTPAYWTVENFHIDCGSEGIKGGIDGNSGADCLYLGVWEDASKNDNGDIANARLYRKVTLPAGKYFFGAEYNNNWNMSDNAYIYVATENVATTEIPSTAIAYCKINEAGTGSTYGITFSLSDEQEVILGFQADLTDPSCQESRVNSVTLISYGSSVYANLQSLIESAEELAAGAKIGNNTGMYSQSAYDTFMAAIEAAKAVEATASDAEIEAAISTLNTAMNVFTGRGKVDGEEPYSTDYNDYTLDILTEADNFTRTDGSTCRYGTPLYWTVENYNIPKGNDGNRNGLDRYPGYDCLSIGIWDDKANNTDGDISNARIYQRVHLDAGRWYFAATYNTTYNLNNKGYIFAATDLMDTDEIPENAIAYYQINVATTENDGLYHGIMFTLDEPQDLILGFQVDMNNGSGEQEFRAKGVTLRKYNSTDEDQKEDTTGMPNFSNDEEEYWYYLIFLAGNNALTDMGTDEYASIYGVNGGNPAQLWKLVGDKDNFHLYSQNGNVLTVDSYFKSTADESQAANLSLVRTRLADYSDYWEIVYNDKTDNYNRMNTWGGSGEGVNLGCYTPNDANNVIRFYTTDEIPMGAVIPEVAEYTINGNDSFRPEHDLTLWYTQSPYNYSVENKWMEYALPIGNGQFGATILGGVAREDLQFNEKTLRSGSTTLYGSYQNFGNVYIDDLTGLFGDGKAVNDYVRYLDMADATANVQFSTPDGSVTYYRQFLASYPDGVVAARLSASEAGKVSVRLYMTNGVVKGFVVPQFADGEARFDGALQTVDFSAMLKVVPTGGTMVTNSDNIEVRDADEVLIILGGATNFDQHSATYVSDADQMRQAVTERVEAAAQKGWNAIYADHLEDYSELFDRVDLDIAGSANNMPTDEMVDYYNLTSTMAADPAALMLERLYFAYGRYLLIGCARGEDTPANLQGIWNNTDSPAWNSDIHSNINVQMNYWLAENTNLSELHENFLNYVHSMALEHSEWQSYAQKSGQTEGWTCFTQNNIFGYSDYAENYVIANAWYTSHFWQHYLYTADRDFLRDKAWPVMLSCIKFWLERLVLADDGTYVAPSEWSPEHGPSAEDGTAHAQQLVAYLFSTALQAIEELGSEAGVSDEFITELNDKYSKLDKGLAIETYNGTWGTSRLASGTEILREWKYSDFSVGQNGHRHQSHLMCVYPLGQIDAQSEYFQPAINSLILRGDDATGWSLAWRINIWARALNGAEAHKCLTRALKHSTSYAIKESASGVYYNLFDSHAPFQIDGNLGTTAGIAEMLLQSYADRLILLPALPEQWASGSIQGLCGIGGFVVDQQWADGTLSAATIYSQRGNECVVEYPKASEFKVTDAYGAEIEVEALSEDLIQFPTSADCEYYISNPNASGISDTMIEATDADPIYYNIQGIQIANPRPGSLYIVKRGSRVTKEIK